MRRWQLAGQDPADTFRGLYVSDDEVESLMARPLGSNWGRTVTLPAPETQTFAEAENEVDQYLEHLLENISELGQTSRLQYLTQFLISIGLNLIRCLSVWLPLLISAMSGFIAICKTMSLVKDPPSTWYWTC